MSNRKSKIRNPKSRAGFTLIELLVAVSIIGMLAAMALGGMYRAGVSAKKTNSQTTVNKIAVQINEIWESYRTRKLPINPTLVLQPSSNKPTSPYFVQYKYAVAWLQYFAAIRSAATGVPSIATFYPDPRAPAGNNGVNPNNNLQIAAIRLAALRELMRLELPSRFLDFTDNPAAINSGGIPPAVTTLLIPRPPNANPGGLSEQYRRFFISHYNASAVPYDPKTSTYEPAECLYMIIRFASQNELGQKSITDDPRLVGDADGDGMPEIQDAFSIGTFTPAAGGSPFTQHNHPISFLRWPLGFISDLQPQPVLLGQPFNSAQPYNYEYASSRHDIFDPMRIDPRAVVLTPLVYTGGPDTSNEIWDQNDYSKISSVTWDNVSNAPPLGTQWIAQIKNDPYYIGLPSLPPVGRQMDVGTTWPDGSVGSGAYADDITSHQLNTRRQ